MRYECYISLQFLSHAIFTAVYLEPAHLPLHSSTPARVWQTEPASFCEQTSSWWYLSLYTGIA